MFGIVIFPTVLDFVKSNKFFFLGQTVDKQSKEKIDLNSIKTFFSTELSVVLVSLVYQDKIKP